MDLHSALSSAFQLLPLALRLCARHSAGRTPRGAQVPPSHKPHNQTRRKKKDPRLDRSFPRTAASPSEIKLAEENMREKVGANESCTRFFGFTPPEKKSVALGKQELVELEEMLPA